MKKLPSLERLHSLLSYDPLSGGFLWKSARSHRKAGDKAGTVATNGYITITIDKVPYSAHRLAWLYVYGEYPELFIDHVNRDKLDNRISNLRLSDNRNNQGNQQISSLNTTGMKGVTKRGNLFHSRIRLNGKKIHLGYHRTLEAAGSAYDAAAVRYFGEFACTNKMLGLL